MLVENPLTARHHGKQPFLQAISRPCLAHSGLCKPCRCWCEGVVCKRLFGFFFGENSLQSATSVRTLQIDAALLSCPYFLPKKRRKGIFFCTISATREQQKTFGFAFVWCGGLLNVKRTPFVFTARLAVRWRKVLLCCEVGKPGFFPSRTQRKIGKSFFSPCYSIHFLRTHQHRRVALWTTNFHWQSEVNKANNNDTGTCYSSRCVITIIQKAVCSCWRH